jgi:hypothetical protein
VHRRRVYLDGDQPASVEYEQNECYWVRYRSTSTAVPSAGTDFISPLVSGYIRILGIFIDADLSMAAHVYRTVSRCFSVLRQLRSVRGLMTTSAFQTLMTSLVATRPDYGNAILYGIAGNQLRRLQAVLNAGARLIFDLRRSDA